MADKYSLEQLVKEFPNAVILRLIGKFYTAFNDSAYVLSEITSYKVVNRGKNGMDRCAFPSEALDKVIGLLNAADVSYVILQQDDIIYSQIADNSNFQLLKNAYLGIDYIPKENDLFETAIGSNSVSKKSTDIFNNSFDSSLELTFKCSNKNMEKLKSLYGKYSDWVYNPASFDFFVNLLISNALDGFKD